MSGPCAKNRGTHVVPSGASHCEHCGNEVLCIHGAMTGSCSECAAANCAQGKHVRSGDTWMSSRCVYCGATDGTVAGDPQCPHGTLLGNVCTQCMSELYGRAATVTVAPSTTDARALLWARTYHWGLRRYHLEANTRVLAVAAAQNAVADFDEHYLGRKPATKG